MFLGNISKSFTANNKKTGLNEKVYNFFVSYETIDVSDSENITKFDEKNTKLYKCLDSLSKRFLLWCWSY